MLIIRNQIQDPNFRSTSSTHSFQISTSWHLVYLCIFGLPKKIPQTLISFRMPIISQHLTMVPSPPLLFLSARSSPKKRIVIWHLSCQDHTHVGLGWDQKPFAWSTLSRKGSHWKHLKLECHPVEPFTKTRVFSCHLYLTWVPDDPATIHHSRFHHPFWS